MSKGKVLVLILFIAALTLVAQVLFGGWLSARLSTWPPLRRFNLFQPQAPIVITNKEVVRTSDTQDAIDATNKVKSRLSAVAMLLNNKLTVVGTAINATGDGYFVTAQNVFATKGAAYFVVLNSGQSLPVTALYADPQTNLMFFRANASSVSVAGFADSEGLQPGQKLVLATGSLTSFTLGFRESWVTALQNDNVGKVFNSDRPSRTFGVQSVGTLAPGETIATLDGEVAGLWDGSSVVSANVIKAAMNLYFSNNQKIVRPVFGFSYRAVTRAESSTLNVPQGALVVKPDATAPAVTAGSPAATAGLQEGDYIIQANDTKVDESNQLEEVLEKIKTGDLVSLTVVRNKQTLILNLTAGEAKI
jgi:S1-C subfamily serine protease